MIVGIGTDLVEMDRIMKACEKQAFLHKLFTKTEQELIQADGKKAAGNFAVKEAVSKMLGTGFRKVTPAEIEVLRDELGKPYVNLYGAAKQLAEQLMIQTIHVTITNTKEYAAAFVIGER